MATAAIDLLSLDIDLLAHICQPLAARTDVFFLRCTSRAWDQVVRRAMRSHATLARAEFLHVNTLAAGALELFGRLCGHACRELKLEARWLATDPRDSWGRHLISREIPEAVLLLFAHRCPNVVRLQLDGTVRLTTDGFVELLKCLPSLEVLCMRDCVGPLRADEAAFRAVGEYCPSIRRFDIPPKLCGDLT